MEKEQAPDPASVTDWISAVCSVIAAVIGLVTVVTVYVAARQLLTERREYRTGLSEETLGPWDKKVKTKQLLGMQQHIALSSRYRGSSSRGGSPNWSFRLGSRTWQTRTGSTLKRL